MDSVWIYLINEYKLIKCSLNLIIKKRLPNFLEVVFYFYENGITRKLYYGIQRF